MTLSSVRHRIEEFAAASLVAVIDGQPFLTRIVLKGIPTSVLDLRVAPSQKTLQADPAAGNISLGEVFKNVPHLEKIVYCLDVVGSHRNLVTADLAILLIPKLRDLSIGNCSFNITSLQELLIGVKGSLRTLQIQNVHLLGGHWVDVFEFMRVHLHLDRLKMRQGLYSDEGIWDFRACLDQDSENECAEGTLDGECLHVRVSAYVRNVLDVRQLRLSHETGARRRWAEVSDTGMAYSPWTRWIKGNYSREKYGDYGELRWYVRTDLAENRPVTTREDAMGSDRAAIWTSVDHSTRKFGEDETVKVLPHKMIGGYILDHAGLSIPPGLNRWRFLAPNKDEAADDGGDDDDKAQYTVIEDAIASREVPQYVSRIAQLKAGTLDVNSNHRFRGVSHIAQLAASNAKRRQAWSEHD